MQRVIAALLAAVLSLCLVPDTASAQQDESGTIKIVVLDQASKAPLELARVVLDGPVQTTEFTDKRGEVIFDDVPDGIYRARILRRNYQTITSNSFEVINGNYVTVNVTLALSTQLKVIGTVVAHSDVQISSSSIGPDSAQRRLSSDLADALSKMSGVTIQTSSDDSDAEQTISLEGHDASQTALTLDGIPLNAPGAAGNIGMFATDLFTGAGVRMGPQMGGLGGGVNFTTLEPTLSYESYLSMATGTNGRYNYSLAETGSEGKLGFAVMSVKRLNTSWLDGMTYLDASGLDYNHNGDSDIDGQFMKLRYEVSDSQTLSGMFLGSSRDTNVACARIQNGIPCGYGPNNTSQGSVGLFSLTDDLLIGGTNVTGTLFSIKSTSLNDMLNEYINGVPSPTGSSGLSSTHGFTLTANLPAAQRHTISLLAYGVWGSNQSFPLLESGKLYYTNDQHSYYSAVQATDTIHSNSHLEFTESAGFSQATGGYGGTLETLGTTWHPNRRDTYVGSYAISGSAAASTRSTLLSNPDSLRYTCDGDDNVAFGNAPGANPEPSSSTSARIGYTHTFGGGNVSLQAYRQVQQNVLLPTDVNGSILLNNGTLSPAYIASVQQIFQSNAGCGVNAPFSPTDLYFSTPIAGVERVYQGAELTGYVTLGDLVLQPFYNETVSTVYSNSPLINNPYSIVLSGQQLPNTPLQRAGVVADFKSPRSALEWYADAQYTGRNNQENLPPFTQFDAAVNVAFSKGSLTFASENIFNTEAGIFSTVQGAIPYLAQNGMTIPTLARPLSPRTYLATYTVKFGPGALGNTHIAQSIAPRGNGRFGGGGGPGGGGGGFRSALTPLPTSPPADPLAVSDNGTQCPSDAHATALTMSTGLKAYIAQIEAAKTAAGYPATMPAPNIPDVTVTYHGLGSTYALSIVPHFQNEEATLASQELANAAARAQGNASGTQQRGRGGNFRVFFGCLPFHIAQPDDVTARHLYQPTNGAFGGPQITFMPAVGLYAIARTPQAGQESFRVYQLPTTAPKDPFEIRTSAPECTADLRNTATEAIAELRKYFTAGSGSTTLWTITQHQAKSGTWYQLAPGDPTMVLALLSCGRVASGTPQQIIDKGWDGVMAPQINYNGSFGLYLIRPQQGQGQGRPPN